MSEKKILVVDDDKRLRDLLQRYLGEQGFAVRTAENAQAMAVAIGAGLASALLFACHIVVVGHFAPQADGVALSCAQFFVAGLMTLPIAFLTEHIPLAGIWEAKWALLYAGVLSCGVAYTLQIVGQKDTPPAIASLTMSLESVFSAIAGAIILHETLQPREMLGCALMLAAVMIAQLPIGRQKKAA